MGTTSKSKSFHAGLAGHVAAAVLALVGAQSALADVVYDSLTGETAHAVYDSTGAFVTYSYPFQCFASCADPLSPTAVSDPITSIGDYVSLTTNTGRSVQSVDIGVFQLNNSAAIDFSVKVSIFSSTTTLQVTQTSALFHLDSFTAATDTFGKATDLTVALGPFNLPDTFYYTISLVDANGSVLSPSGFGIRLWDYYQDGTFGSIPVGTDIGNTGSVDDGTFVTQVYGTDAASGSTLTTSLGNNEAGLSDGYTPAVRFNVDTPVALAVPEPETYMLMIAGLLAVGSTVRRQKRVK